MKDFEGNEIKIFDGFNPSVLVTGRARMGKSYFSCRMIENSLEEKKQVMIIDYSGSYTEKQLSENSFTKMRDLNVLNPQKNPVYWTTSFENEDIFALELADAVIEVLRIQSFFQMEWLRKGVITAIKISHELDMRRLTSILLELHTQKKKEEGSLDDVQNIEKVLSRLFNLSTVTSIKFRNNHTESQVVLKRGKVIQLSGFPEAQKSFFTDLFVTLIWKESIKNEKAKFDLVVLDEFQHISLYKDSALIKLLREGAKTKIQLLLLTQYVGSYDKEIRNALTQAGNFLMFNPSPDEERFCLNLLCNNTEERSVWKQILRGLKQGQAVLKGNFVIVSNGRTKEQTVVKCVI